MTTYHAKMKFNQLQCNYKAIIKKKIFNQKMAFKSYTENVRALGFRFRLLFTVEKQGHFSKF